MNTAGSTPASPPSTSTDTDAGVVVAVDGTSGSGKSSTSRGVAARLGLRYLDTGAMYRAMTWWMLQHGVPVDDPAAVASRATEAAIVSGTDPSAPTITLDGEDVSGPIRSDAVNGSVSPVSAVPQVRALMQRQQRAIIEDARSGAGIVVEGRDIGSVVWPQADLKVFLSADPGARAARRAREEGSVDAEQIAATRASLEARDAIDSTRRVSPLTQADGAVHLDTTAYSLDEVIDTLSALVEQVRSAR